MPITFELDGRTVTLTEAEAEDVLRRMVSLVRVRMRNPAVFRFDNHYRRFAEHNRYRSVNFILHVVETAGGATLPNAGRTNRLKRERDSLERMLRPNQLPAFLTRFAAWNLNSADFCNEMVRYAEKMELGTTRTIRVLNLTRQASFQLLQVLAVVATGGGAAAGGAAARVAATAGRAFVVHMLEQSATDLGRAMAGDPPTVSETGQQIVQRAVGSLTDAMLGHAIGDLMEPITGVLAPAAQRELRNGNLLRSVTITFSEDQVHGAVQNALRAFAQRAPAELRRIMGGSDARNRSAAAAQIASGVMANRQFRAQLERCLEQQTQ